MKLDVELYPPSIDRIPELARKAEESGFDCLWVNETKHDPFVQLASAALGTARISVGTSVALAFTRSPTSIAYAAWDLQSLSRGRLILGLGSQVKGHLERRFGVRWESPAPKMREVVQATRAVWKSWQGGTPLYYQGRFFKLDLMTPFFSPGPIAYPRIPIYVAAVNKRMCFIAGEVADGLHVHPLHTLRYLDEVVLPSVSAGAKKGKRKRRDAAVAVSVFAAVGESRSQISEAWEACRSQVAFYASTRTYRRVLELHGLGDVCDRLHSLSVKGEWKKMAAEVDDDVLKLFAIEGSWKEAGRTIKERYEGVADRVRLYMPFNGSGSWEELAEGFRA